MKSLVLLLVGGLSVHSPLCAARVVPVQRAKAGDGALAPDGKRGFGTEMTQRDIDHLWSSKEMNDRAFFGGLTEVSTEVRIAALGVRQHYSDRGYFKTIAGSAGDDLALLHASYAQWLAQPAGQLSAGDVRAQAFAAMLIDTRFNVRRGLLEQAELSLRELERARAVFGASIKGGFTTLFGDERKTIATRADLAAAELRALRNDLDVLKPGPADFENAAADLELSRGLLEAARIQDELTRDRMLADLLAPRRELERRMQSVLFTMRAEPGLRALHRWRDRMVAEGADLRAQALAMIPDTLEGQKPSAMHAKLGKSERFRQAAKLAVQGLLSDSLDPDLAWAAGHAHAFSNAEGRLSTKTPAMFPMAVMYFDRFLVLSGVHFSDAHPGQGRQLSVRETEALDAVVAAGNLRDA